MVPVASAARDSAVVEATATRATKAAIAPVVAVLVSDESAPADEAGSAAAAVSAAADPGAVPDDAVPLALDAGVEVAQRPDVEEALECDGAADGASPVGAGAEVDQRPDVEVAALDDAAVGARAEGEPVALGDGVTAVDVGGVPDRLDASLERPADGIAAVEGADGEEAEEAAADELPGRVGRGGGFAAGGGDAAGAGRAGGTGGTATFEVDLLTVAGRGAELEFAAADVADRLAAGDPPPEDSCAPDEGECEPGACDWTAGEPECAVE